MQCDGNYSFVMNKQKVQYKVVCTWSIYKLRTKERTKEEFEDTNGYLFYLN